jgi:ABC-2 type transport system permease protein
LRALAVVHARHDVVGIFFGLLAKTTEGAGAFSYILLLLVFVSSGFVPTSSMTPLLRGFAENQPMTPGG